MIPCPTCHAPNREGPTCQACGADMRLPLLLDHVGRLCFNRALDLLKKGALAQAENELCAACALMPLRPEARRALAKLRAQAGRLDAAAEDLRIALQLAPQDADAAAANAEVERLARRERRLLLIAPVVLAVLTFGGGLLLWTLR